LFLNFLESQVCLEKTPDMYPKTSLSSQNYCQ